MRLEMLIQESSCPPSNFILKKGGGNKSLSKFKLNLNVSFTAYNQQNESEISLLILLHFN